MLCDVVGEHLPAQEDGIDGAERRVLAPLVKDAVAVRELDGVAARGALEKLVGGLKVMAYNSYGLK